MAPLPPHLRNYIAANYGGALRNAVYGSGITCEICFTPVEDGYNRCFCCNQHAGIARTADRVGSIVYAVGGDQSHHFMRSYKGSPAVEEARLVVFLLIWGALSDHTPCLEKLTGREVTHWASVPSLPAKPGIHALRPLIMHNAPWREVPLLAAVAPAPHNLREVDATHYLAAFKLPPGAHALVIDDTWTRGGHAQSAALAMRSAGAATVSILNVARFLNKKWGPTDNFLRIYQREDFDSSRCPWAGGSCP